jgi:nitrogen fixation/metabolism regulation signal transduction histidine kinase
LKPGTVQATDETEEDLEDNEEQEIRKKYKKKINFTRDDLKLARRIYDQILKEDLDMGRVTPALLRYAREPNLAL